jgi:tetratricopeptide (TPR) repeat protein
VRSSAARVLDQAAAGGSEDARRALVPLLEDPFRVVRQAAAWSLRDRIDPASGAGQELMHMLHFNADQPTGQMQLGQFHFSRGNTPEAIRHIETAIRWDPNSPPFHHDLAVMQSTAGNAPAAIKALREAVRLDPGEPDYHYKLALAQSETGNLDETVASLREAVKLRPGFGRAWYNLALALNSQGKVDEALKTLQMAEAADPRDPAIPFAAATILIRYDRKEEAMAAAARVLQIQPDHPEARQLVRALQGR